MHIDHHENVCRSRPQHVRVHSQRARCSGERKHSLNIFSLNRANRELETENKRTTATSTQKFRRNIWDLSFFSLRHLPATFSALLEPVLTSSAVRRRSLPAKMKRNVKKKRFSSDIGTWKLQPFDKFLRRHRDRHFLVFLSLENVDKRARLFVHEKCFCNDLMLSTSNWILVKVEWKTVAPESKEFSRVKSRLQRSPLVDSCTLIYE